MTLEELLEKLLDIKHRYGDDPETAHGEMDDAFLEYFAEQGPVGKAISDAFDSQERWYS